MKKLYQYTMVLLAGVLGACGSMSVNDPYAEALPADFNTTVYMNLHPELRTAQIKDYVAFENDVYQDSVTKAGGDYSAIKTADETAFLADVASLMQICTNPLLAGWSAERCAAWETDAAVKKDLLAFNIVGTVTDLAALTAIPTDEVAISQQFIVFGQSHGWAYRACTETEAANPTHIIPEDPVDADGKPIANKATSEAEFVADTHLYCRDAAGVDHLIQ